jgi:hypothetical protein
VLDKFAPSNGRPPTRILMVARSMGQFAFTDSCAPAPTPPHRIVDGVPFVFYSAILIVAEGENAEQVAIGKLQF